MIEAELKARLREPDVVRAALAGRATAESATYRDVYYDSAGGDLDRAGRELRLRTINTGGLVRQFLTFKEAAVDSGSGSKPEYESSVGDVAAVDHLLRALGYEPSIELTKECENYRFSAGGRDFLATLARVPELDGTFLEVETMAGRDGVPEALAAVRDQLDVLGVTPSELTTELYTAAVRASRARR